MAALARIKAHWARLHQGMLDREKEELGFPGPSSVMRLYNSFTTFFRVLAAWEFMEAKPGDRVLLVGDAGAGGKDYWFYAWNGVWCDVVDVAEQASIPNVVIHDISAPGLPFEPGTFDVAVMCDVLEHIYNDTGALANLHSLLKDGGRLVLSGPYWHDLPEFHVRIHSPRIIRRMLRHHGFKIRKVISRGFLINVYRLFHAPYLLLHYLLFRLTGKVRMIECNRLLYRLIKGVQARDFVPYLDRALFGQAGGANGYVLWADKDHGPGYDAVAINRESFENTCI
jgi:SAM-dependent methyltransferase